MSPAADPPLSRATLGGVWNGHKCRPELIRPKTPPGYLTKSWPRTGLLAVQRGRDRFAGQLLFGLDAEQSNSTGRHHLVLLIEHACLPHLCAPAARDRRRESDGDAHRVEPTFGKLFHPIREVVAHTEIVALGKSESRDVAPHPPQKSRAERGSALDVDVRSASASDSRSRVPKRGP